MVAHPPIEDIEAWTSAENKIRVPDASERNCGCTITGRIVKR